MADVREGAGGLSRRLALAAPLAALPACAVAQVTRSAEAVLRDFLHAFENCDLSLMEAAFAPDATSFDPVLSAPNRTAPVDLTDFRRKPGMPPGMRRLAMELPKTQAGPPYQRLEPHELLVQEVGEVAVCSFHLETERGRLGRRTVILVQRGGAWRILHIHASNIQI